MDFRTKYSTFSVVIGLFILSCVIKSEIVDRKTFVKDILGINEKTLNKNETALKNGISFSDNVSLDPFLNNNPKQKIAYIHAIDPKTNMATNSKYQAGYFEEMSL